MSQSNDNARPAVKGALWAIREVAQVEALLESETEKYHTLRGKLIGRRIDAEWVVRAHCDGHSAQQLVSALNVLSVTPLDCPLPTRQTLQEAHAEMQTRRSAYDNASLDLAIRGYFSSFEADGYKIAFTGKPDSAVEELEGALYVLANIRNQRLYWPGDPRNNDPFGDADEADGDGTPVEPAPPAGPGSCGFALRVAAADGLEPRAWKEQLAGTVPCETPLEVRIFFHQLDLPEIAASIREESLPDVPGFAYVPTIGTPLAHALNDEVRRSKGLHPGNAAMLETLQNQVTDLGIALNAGAPVEAVQREALQTACVALRIYQEGDADFAPALCNEAEDIYTDAGADAQEGGRYDHEAVQRAVAAHQAGCGACGGRVAA